MPNRNHRRPALLVEALEERTLLNAGPVLTLPQTNFAVVKTSALTVPVSATDRDRGETIVFSLIGAPAGASISTTQVPCSSGSAANGTLSWTPTEDQGPACYSFTIVATDNGSPVRTASKTVTVSTLAVGVVGKDLWIVGTSTNQGTTTNPGNDTVSVSATDRKNTVFVSINGCTDCYTVPTGGQIVTKLFGGNDSFTLNEGPCAQVVGPAISVDGGTGTNTLTINGTPGPDAFTITGTTVGFAGAGTVTYANVQTLFVNGLGGGDTFAMTGINPATATTLDGGAGTNSFNGTFAGDFSGSLTLADMQSATLSVAGTVTAGSTITGTNFSNLSLGTLAGTLLAQGGSITGATIGTVAPAGLLEATETVPGSTGVLSNATIGNVAGSVIAGVISNCQFTTIAAGGTVTAQGQGTTSDVTIGTLDGTLQALEDSTPGSGIMTDTSIDTIGSCGVVSTGSISGMKVGTTDAGSSITAAGQGTTSDVTIGTLDGTLQALEDSSAGSGIMMDTTIDEIGSTGVVSTGSISGMKVGTTDGGSSITAAGQGTTSDVTIGTLDGTLQALEDSSAGSGTMTDTSIDNIGSTGVVSTGSISGMKVGTTDAGSSITAAGQGTTSDVTIGTLDGTLQALEDSSAGSGIMTDTTIDTIGSTGDVSTGSISGMKVGTTDAGSSITAAGAGTIDSLTIDQHSGTVTAVKDTSPGSGSLTNTTVGTLTATGIINADTAAGLDITTDTGTVNITNSLTDFGVGTLLGTANLSAGHFVNVTAQHVGPIVHFIEPSVTRTVAVTPHVPGGAVPDYGLYYDGTGSGNPSVVVNLNAATVGNFDLAVTTTTATNAGAGFDLAGVYSTSNNQTGIHNLVVGGNLLLGAVPAGAVSFFGLPANTTGGVQLPNDIVAIAVAGNLPAASIVAKSVPSLAAHSFAGVAADSATSTNVRVPLAAGTGLSQANDAFQLFFSEAGDVAQFLVTGSGGSFDSKKMLFADIVVDNAPVTAQDTLIPTGSYTSVNSVAFSGQGASLTTAQPIISMISDIGGSIGNLILSSPYGLANVTADSIIGNIVVPNGAINGVVETTVGDLGRAFTDLNGNITGVTTIQAGGLGLSGKILAKGNLVSQVNLQCGLGGVVATDGDIGTIQTTGGAAKLNPNGSLIRFGGIVVCSGGITGQIIALGNAFGDITVGGWLSGRIAVKGNQGEYGLASFRYGILGNVSVCGGVSSTGAIVSSGLIGDDGTNNITNDKYGTHLTIIGRDQGIIAAGEDINFGVGDSDDDDNYFGGGCGQNRANIFENATGSNLAAINAIFTNNGGLLDVLDPVQLNLIVKDLLALKVSSGKLTGTTP
jgi:hypothetical protein